MYMHVCTYIYRKYSIVFHLFTCLCIPPMIFLISNEFGIGVGVPRYFRFLPVYLLDECQTWSYTEYDSWACCDGSFARLCCCYSLVLASLSHSSLLLKTAWRVGAAAARKEAAGAGGTHVREWKDTGFHCWWPWLLAHAMIRVSASRAGRHGSWNCLSYLGLRERKKDLLYKLSKKITEFPLRVTAAVRGKNTSRNYFIP